MVSQKTKILGDYQTPLELVQSIIQRLKVDGWRWTRMLEPTCGVGAFIEGVLPAELGVQEIVGIEIQQAYREAATSKLYPMAAEAGIALRIMQRDVFGTDTHKDIHWETDGPLLILGNPPWITNAGMAVLEGDNLPTKTNFKQFKGLDALTGKSNFDISEYIWYKLIADHAIGTTREPVTIALLCKTAVARNVLQHARKVGLPISNAAIYEIPSQKWFGVSVAACLFVVTTDHAAPNYTASVYARLDDLTPHHSIGYVNEAFVSNVDVYEPLQFLDAGSPLQWRSGVKHDAASVMELRKTSDGYVNNLGEYVEVEAGYLYPLLKGSDVKHYGSRDRHRFVIVTQQSIADDTRQLATHAPQLWHYLTTHDAIFASRKSSIYRNRPPYAMFGVGDYSFTDYKIIISGLHKDAQFVPVGPRDGKPVLCDDTCYLLPTDNAAQACLLAAALNHTRTQAFISSLAFRDAKRPITKSVLGRIDLAALLSYLPHKELIDDARKLSQELMPTDAVEDELEANVRNLTWLQAQLSLDF